MMVASTSCPRCEIRDPVTVEKRASRIAPGGNVCPSNGETVRNARGKATCCHEGNRHASRKFIAPSHGAFQLRLKRSFTWSVFIFRTQYRTHTYLRLFLRSKHILRSVLISVQRLQNKSMKEQCALVSGSRIYATILELCLRTCGLFVPKLAIRSARPAC